MPFMKGGQGAIRRTLDYLKKGDIILRDNIRVVSFAYNPGQKYTHHDGLHKFVYWHLPQVKYKNPTVHYTTFKMMTPSPWIKAYMEDDTSILIDCESRSRQEIHDHVRLVLGKTEEEIQLEMDKVAAMTANPANFGSLYERQCICEIPGQVPCPGWKPLPQEMTGKWRIKMRTEAASDS